MKFNTVQELIEYVHLIGDDCIQNYDISITPVVEMSTPVTETKTINEGAVSIHSFSDSPKVTAKLDESLEENVLYVEDYDSVPMSCSTGKVSLLGRTIYTNVCESETGPTIYLNVGLDEAHHLSIPFKLKKTCDNDSDYIMLLNPKTLSSNE